MKKPIKLSRIIKIAPAVAFFGCVVLFFVRADEFLTKTDFYKRNAVLTICAILFVIYGLYFWYMDSRADKKHLAELQKENEALRKENEILRSRLTQKASGRE